MYLKWMKTKVANVLMHAQASWSETFPLETLHPDELNQLCGIISAYLSALVRKLSDTE